MADKTDDMKVEPLVDSTVEKLGEYAVEMSAVYLAQCLVEKLVC